MPSPLLVDFPVEIHTPRLLLRVPREGDAEALRRTLERSMDRLACSFPWALALKRAGKLPDPAPSVAAAIARFTGASEPSYYLFPAGEPDVLAGELLLRERGPMTVELGIWLRSGHEGAGLSLEAAEAVIAELHRRGAHGVIADCHPDNRSARRLLEQAGWAVEWIDDRAIYRLDLKTIGGRSN